MHAPAVLPEPEMPSRRKVAVTTPSEAADTYQCPRDDPGIFARKRAFDEGAERWAAPAKRQSGWAPIRAEIPRIRMPMRDDVRQIRYEVELRRIPTPARHPERTANLTQFTH